MKKLLLFGLFLLVISQPSNGKGKPDQGKVSSTNKAKAGDRTEEKQKEERGKILGKDPKIKEASDKIKNARSKADVKDGVMKTKDQIRMNRTTMSDFEVDTISDDIFKAGKKSGYISTYEIIAEMGSLALALKIKDYKAMDKASLLKVLEIGRTSSDGRKLPRVVQKFIFARLVKLLKPNEWTVDMGKNLAPLKDVIPDHKDIKKLSTDALRGILTFLNIPEDSCGKKTPKIIKYFLSSKFPAEFKTQILPRFGNFLCYISMKQLKSLPNNIIQTETEVKQICSAKWSPAKVKVVSKLARYQSSFNNLTNLTCDEIRSFGNCWGSVKSQEFQAINFTMDLVECFNTTVLPTRLKSNLARKMRSTYGELSQLGVGEIRKLISAYGASASDLLSLNATMLKDVAQDIKKQIKNGGIKDKVSVKVAAERIVETSKNDQSFRLSKLPKKLISTLSLTTVADISTDKLGFSEAELDSAPSSTTDDDDDKDEPMSTAIALNVIAKLIAKYGKINNNTNYWRKAIKGLARTRSFVCGFKPSAIAELSEESFQFFVSAIKNSGAKCPAMRDEVSKKYKKIKKNEGSTSLTAYDFRMMGSFARDLSASILVNTSDDADTRLVAIGSFKETCDKGNPEWFQRNIAKIALAMLKIISGTAITADTIDTIGCLIVYVEYKTLRDIPTDVIMAKIEELGEYKFPNMARREFLKRIKEKHAKNGDTAKALSEISADQFSKYVKLILPVLTVADIGNLTKEAVQQNIDQLAALGMTSDQAKAIIAKRDASKRKRRAVTTDLSTKTATAIIEMGTLLYGLSADDINTISNDTFKSALDTIGALSGFTATQLEAWVKVLKRAYGSISSIPDADLKRIKHLILGMSSSDIQSLKLSNLEVISELSKIEAYTTAKIGEIYAEIKKDLGRTDVKGFTKEELVAAEKFIRGADHTKLDELTADVYKFAAEALGKVVGWSTNHLTALKASAITAYGSVSTWDASVSNYVGAALAGCTGSELNAMSLDVFKAAKPVAIQQIPPSEFALLDNNHLTGFTSEQFASVTVAQKNYLTSAQLSAFKTASGEDTVLNVDNLVKTECSNWPCSGAAKQNSVLFVAVIFTLLSILSISVI